MVKSSSGVAGYRSFTIVDVTKHGGCRTKFHGGLYKSRNPVGAARKAFTKFCKAKRIRGVCTLFVTVRETTAGSKKKTYTYKLNRHKLAKPLVRRPKGGKEFVIEYKSTARSTDVKESCRKSKPIQTRGRMKTKTSGRKRPSPKASNINKLVKRLGLDNGPVSSRTRRQTKKGGASKKRNHNKKRSNKNKRNNRN